MKGFGALERPGAPAVPFHRQRVAIPEGSAPQLRIVRVSDRPLAAGRIEPFPSAGDTRLESPAADRPGSGEPRRSSSFAPDPSIYGADADYPESVVSLGEIGWLRDQRYVDLIFTPVRVNPVTGAARVAEEVEVEILVEPAALGPTAVPRPDPHAAGIYRGAFVNAPSPCRTGGAAARTSASIALESTGTTYKLALKEEGIYRVTCPSLGSCPIPALIGLDPASFRLRNKGVEVPMRVIDGGDGSFDVGDILEFYGQPQADPFAVVNCGPPTCFTPIYQSADFTDVNVYLLDDPGPSGRLRMASLDGTPGGLAAEPDFLATAHAEVNDRFLPLNAADPFYWNFDFKAGGNATCDLIGSRCRNLSVPLPGKAPISFASTVTVRLRGTSSLSGSNPDHRTQVDVNGLGTTVFDWDGETIQDFAIGADQSALSDPATVHLEEQTLGGVNVDQAIPDYVEITYRRLFQAASDRLSYDFPNQAAKFAVGGFSGGAIQAYDVSRLVPGTVGTREPRLVVNASAAAGTITFQLPSEAPPTGASRRTLVVGSGGYRAPDTVTVLASSTLLDPANEADYLILSRPSLIDPAPGSPYQNFVSYLQNGRGLTAKLVDVEQVYDAFSDSIEDPEAIRSFLAYAHDNWVGPSGNSPPPAYLLLVGDAVWDTKNNLNRGDWIDLVPTPIMFFDQAILKYYAADQWLASFVGSDQAADILYGRLGARTLAQANTQFGKILAYAQSPPAGSWRSGGLFVTDVGNDIPETQIFELTENLSAAHFVPPFSFVKQYYAQPPYNAPTGGGGPVAQFKADFVSNWNTFHPAIASYTGHGAFDLLGNDLFFRSTDVPLLTNGPFLPFLIIGDCLGGGFHAVGTDSIAEAFTGSAAGGSVAAFAPAGLSTGPFSTAVKDRMFDEMFGPVKERELGVLAAHGRDALYEEGNIVGTQGYVLIGDPSLRLVIPAPAPPGGFTAAAGDGVVNLAWSVSGDPTAVTTRIYRATSPGGPYTGIIDLAAFNTAHADTTVANGTTYFYRAVSVDAGGFEGAVTNTNADCGATPAADGPQCRRAQPLNLDPPAAPSGVKVRDTGSGTSLEVSWLANSENDIKRYEVAYGTTSGDHPTVRNAGLNTSLLIDGLDNGTTYYFVVRAVNTSNVNGFFSGEVPGTPHTFFGIAPPRTIQDLAVNTSGNDLVLTWGAVTTDIYGIPLTVNHYNVYRGTTPTFVPNDAVNRIGQVPAMANPSFTHVGGRVTPDNGFYLVSALDSDGFASGLGTDLPAGVLALTVVRSTTPGMLTISWPAVGVTVNGQPTSISHYRLHGSTSPLPRRLVAPANLLLDNITGTTVDVTEPAGSKYYYNLVVVDVRGNVSPY